MKKYLPLTVPVALYVGFAISKIYILRAGIIIFLMFYVFWLIAAKAAPEDRNKLLFVPAAFLFSIFGDLSLHFQNGRTWLFLVGVALYFVAHLCYIGFFMRKGQVNYPMLALLCSIFILYYIFLLRPNIASLQVSIAVVLYILVSCFSVSTASGMPLGPSMDRLGKQLAVAGICSLVFSDLVLSLHNFAGISTGYFLMLPTFYLSQTLITASLIHNTLK